MAKNGNKIQNYRKVIDKYNFGTATNAVGAECGIGAAVMSVTQDIVLINESTISATTEKSTVVRAYLLRGAEEEIIFLFFSSTEQGCRCQRSTSRTRADFRRSIEAFTSNGFC